MSKFSLAAKAAFNRVTNALNCCARPNRSNVVAPSPAASFHGNSVSFADARGTELASIHSSRTSLFSRGDHVDEPLFSKSANTDTESQVVAHEIADRAQQEAAGQLYKGATTTLPAHATIANQKNESKKLAADVKASIEGSKSNAHLPKGKVKRVVGNTHVNLALGRFKANKVQPFALPSIPEDKAIASISVNTQTAPAKAARSNTGAPSEFGASQWTDATTSVSGTRVIPAKQETLVGKAPSQFGTETWTDRTTSVSGGSKQGDAKPKFMVDLTQTPGTSYFTSHIPQSSVGTQSAQEKPKFMVDLTQTPGTSYFTSHIPQSSVVSKEDDVLASDSTTNSGVRPNAKIAQRNREDLLAFAKQHNVAVPKDASNEQIRNLILRSVSFENVHPPKGLVRKAGSVLSEPTTKQEHIVAEQSKEAFVNKDHNAMLHATIMRWLESSDSSATSSQVSDRSSVILASLRQLQDGPVVEESQVGGKLVNAEQLKEAQDYLARMAAKRPSSGVWSNGFGADGVIVPNTFPGLKGDAALYPLTEKEKAKVAANSAPIVAPAKSEVAPDVVAKAASPLASVVEESTDGAVDEAEENARFFDAFNAVFASILGGEIHSFGVNNAAEEASVAPEQTVLSRHSSLASTQIDTGTDSDQSVLTDDTQARADRAKIKTPSVISVESKGEEQLRAQLLVQNALLKQQSKMFEIALAEQAAQERAAAAALAKVSRASSSTGASAVSKTRSAVTAIEEGKDVVLPLRSASEVANPKTPGVVTDAEVQAALNGRVSMMSGVAFESEVQTDALPVVSTAKKPVIMHTEQQIFVLPINQ